MGQALYRRYRPKSLAEVVGQEHITDTLVHALKQGKLAHAYLFTGPRGTGKTSIARILAHEINQLPYEDDSAHLDIIEIDAASNRRIDEIRDLRDKVHTAPTSAKYKVYIIDEVHMLTREAFNALLKTLEEPPAHVVFILATTEAHKLPETIVSRTQRFTFRPYALQQVATHLRTIADKEAMEISDEALDLIAAYGEGSFRDSISLLDQTRGHDGRVEVDFIRSLIGVPTTEAIDDICAALANADAPALVKTLTQLREQGFAAPQVAKHLGQRLRADVIAGKGQAGIFELLGELLDVPAKHNPESALELSLLGYSLANQLPAAPAKAATQQAPAPTPRQAAVIVQQPPVQVTASQPLVALVTPFRTRPSLPTVAASGARMQSIPQTAETDNVPQQLGEPIDVDAQLWPEVLNILKKSHNTLYGITRMARPIFYQDAVELGFTFAFHKKRVGEPKNREIITLAIKQLSGKEIGVRCTLLSKDTGQAIATPFDDAPSEGATGPKASDSPAPDIGAISNIFGSAEVLGA